jgi:putative ABC transport system permease protein
MQLKDIALNNLRRRKIKVLFLALGLIFGVATVVTLITITQAMKANMNDQFKGIGSKVVVKPKTDKLSFSYGPIVIASGVAYDIKELTSQVVVDIKEAGKENISVIAPKLLESTNIVNKQTMVVGVDFEQELKLKPYWSFDGNVPKKSNELLIGSKVAKSFNLSNGSNVKIKEKEFIVSGIISETGSEEDGLMFIQLPALQSLANKPNTLTFVEVSVAGGDNDVGQVDSVVGVLRSKLPEANVTAVKEAMEARKQLVDRFANFSIIISVIVTLIGALIILSTMMSSVNERIREIGIFRAIGFRKSHIVKIIMIEAGAISLVGALLGYGIGMVIAVYAAPLVTQLKLIIGWNPVMMVSVIVAAIVIGLLSTVHPAVKASKMEPAEALRFI